MSFLTGGGGGGDWGISLQLSPRTFNSVMSVMTLVVTSDLPTMGTVL